MITTMYDTATICRREFVARRDLLWVGVAAAILILILPFLPGLSNLDHGDVRSAAALGFSLGAGLVLSIGLGASLFGVDLSEGRLGFFFERPVNTSAVWIGRFAAAYLLVILCEAVIIAAGGAWLRQSALLELSLLEVLKGVNLGRMPDWPLWLVVAPIYLLLVSHCLSVMLRARTAWLALDVVGTVMAVTSAWLALRPLVAGGFDRAVEVVGSGVAAGFLLALLAGTAIGLGQGRTEIRRTHCFLSITLWGVLALALGGLVGYSTWLMSFGTSDFEEISVGHISPDGSWAEVQGGAKGHLDVRRQFLISTDGQRALPLPTITGQLRSWWTTSSVQVSADGSRAVWISGSYKEDPGTLWYVDLQADKPEPVATWISLDDDSRFEISPDGATIAYFGNRTLSVFDLQEERFITAARMEDNEKYLLFSYTNPENLRLLSIRYREVGDYTWDRYLRFSDLAVERGSRPITRNIVREPHGQYSRFDRGLEYVVYGFDSSRSIRRALQPRQTIFNAVSGGFEKNVKGLFGGFLPDNRFWSVYLSEGGSVVLTFDSLRGEGETKEFEFGPIGMSIVVSGGIGGTMFIASDIAGWRGLHEWAWKDIEVLNLESGERRPLGEELAIIGLREENTEFPDGTRTTIFTNPSAVTLFRDRRGALLSWDPEIGMLKHLAGAN